MRNGGKAREEEEVYRPVAEGFRRVTLSRSDVSLQEAPPTAVTSEAEGHKCGPRAKGEQLCQSQWSSLDLPRLPIQQQPLSPALSASDGTATSLSSVEREAIRMRGRPWMCCGADLNNLPQYYPVWITWKRMSKERKSRRQEEGQVFSLFVFSHLLLYSTSCLL